MKDFEENQLGHIPELEQKKNIFGRWAGFFISRYRIVYLLIAAILIWGIGAYLKMPRELQPEVILPYGHVLTTYVGAAPEEMEALVTKKIEKKLDELEKVKSINSSSGYGYSSVFVEFEQGVDMDSMMQKMRDKVSAVQSELPADAEVPQIMSLETNNTPIMIINVSGDYDFVTLKNYAERIKEEIEKNKEITEVQIIGGLEREIKVIVNPQKLSVYNISLEQIKNAIALSNINFPGGDIVLDNKNYNIRTVGEFANVKDLENIVITYMGSSPLFLKDIAEIEDGYASPKSYSRMSNHLGTNDASVKKAVAITVKKKEEADVIKTSNKIHKLLEKGEGSLYPKELQVEVSGDTAEYVEDELGTVVQNSKSGLLLVIIVLFLFIGFGESLVVSMVIPLSIFIAFGLMDITGMTFNNITLFSLILAVGMLVDNGIVIMENIDRLRLMGLPTNLAAEVGTNQIAPAVASSTLTTLAAFFPIMLTTGIMGAFIKPIPITVIFALSASYFVAITITPALCTLVLKEHRRAERLAKHPLIEKGLQVASVLFVFVLSLYAFKNEEGGLLGFGTLSIIFAVLFSGAMIAKKFLRKGDRKEHFIIGGYGKILYDIVKSKWRRRAVVGTVFIAFVLSLALIPLGILKVEMFAQNDYTRLYVNIEAPLGTSLDTTSAIAEEVEKRLLSFKEIKSFVSNVGITGADSLETITVGSASNPNTARIIIDLHDKKVRDKTSMELAVIFREAIKDIPGAKIEVQELEDGPPTGKPIYIELNSENFEDLKLVADDFTGILKSLEGTRDVESSMEEGSPELQIKVDKKKASYLGLDDMTVALGIRNAVNGLKATTFRNNQDEIDVIIHTSKEKLQSKDDLEKIYFPSRLGQMIPLSQVAEVIETKSITAIHHEDLKRQVSIAADVLTGTIPGDVTKAFKEAISTYPIPESMTIGYGGEEESMQESFTDMFTNMVIAAILVFLILAIQFNSLSQPLIILFSVPMALIGVMPGLVLTGNTFGFVSFVGVVALVGIAVNDAIVLVDYINYLRKSGYSLQDAVKETGVTRFMPVMATTITTVGGILPITIRQPFFAPMGYALICGLSMATILTLLVVPVLYTMLEEFKMTRKQRKEKDRNKGGLGDEKAVNPVIGH
ncbi:efflux RND transporter permease subunit [Anaerosolibacter sp.]|uniref:efflux RND transporter permease subunit n=1 Tax=Anaerosolibacter sp. TaxID=1872527 RepID=UPI0039EE2797